MADFQCGEIEKNLVIKWKIDDFFSKAEASTDLNYSLATPKFYVSDVKWQLRLYPVQGKDYIAMDLFLNKDMLLQHTVAYSIAIVKNDHSVEQIVTGDIKGNERSSGSIQLITKRDLLQRKSELVPNNTLTIICTLTMTTEDHTFLQPPALAKTKTTKLIRLDKLSENFKDLFDDKETCDTILKVNDKEYTAHRCILSARSKVFAATFRHDMLERDTGIITIKDCDSESFQKFLEYLYFGKIEEISFHSALNLYYTSNKYDVEEVKAFCVEYLRESFYIENICEIIVFADRYDEMELFSEAQDFFNKNAFEILLTSEWDDFIKKDLRLASKLLKEMSKDKLKK